MRGVLDLLLFVAVGRFFLVSQVSDRALEVEEAGVLGMVE